MSKDGSRKGARLPSEHRVAVDEETGTVVHQMTVAPAVSHHLYFLTRSITAGGRMVFASYRSGTAQLYVTEFPKGEMVQLTDGDPVHGFSAHLSGDDRRLLFVRNTPAAAEVWTLDLETLAETPLASFPGGQLGELALSRGGRFVVSALKQDGQYHLALLELADGGAGLAGEPALIHSRPGTIIHAQFSPGESSGASAEHDRGNDHGPEATRSTVPPESPDGPRGDLLIEFAGDPAPRMHVIRGDGSGLRCLYEHGNDEFVVHECFLTPETLAFVHWPFALRTLDIPTGAVRDVARFNAWHIAPDRAGRRILCDTAHPDTGLQIVDVATGARQRVCASGASNGGSQWRTSRYALAEDFAAAARQGAGDRGAALSWMEMKVDTVYGPQWTHPHPSWSPDERHVVFTSDRSGTAQVYIAEVPGAAQA